MMNEKLKSAANIGYTSGGFQSNLQARGSLARAVAVDNESATEPARCIPTTLCVMQECYENIHYKKWGFQLLCG